MHLDPSPITSEGGTRVHANKCHVPICKLPQALEFSTNWESGLVSVMAISGSSRVTLARMSAIAILRRWLPVVWGKSSLENQGSSLLPDEIEPRQWSLQRTVNPRSIRLSIPGFSPVSEFDAAEIENALMISCARVVESSLKGVDFPVHDISAKHERVRMINNRIHDVAQEVDEIDL